MSKKIPILIILCLTISLVFLVNSSVLSNLKDPAKTSTYQTVSLILKKGLSSGTVYADLTLDLICNNHTCDSTVWGFAPEFNQAEHSGSVRVNQLNTIWNLDINLTINRDPWLSLTGQANYQIQLQESPNNQLIGYYEGTFNNQPLQGEVSGNITPLFPEPIPNHQPIKPQEHPRLIFRQTELKTLRKKAKTPTGQLILSHLQRTLNEPINYQGYVPDSGYHAAGQCFLALLNQKPEKATIAWEIVQNVMNQPAPRLFEQSPTVAGVALAYDLCYDFWKGSRGRIVTQWLAQKTQTFVEGNLSQGWNPTPWSNWNARVRGAAGLGALAILNEPEIDGFSPSQVRQWLTIAQRNMTRYLATGIGDRAFGSEGDHYSTEPWILTVFPFIQAYRNVEGKDFLQGNRESSSWGNAAWMLPHYLTRIIPKNQQYPILAYGRHRNYGGGALFAMGLNNVPKAFLPGVLWGFNRYWGLEGDRSFGINNPLTGIFAFVGYPDGIIPQNPASIFSRVLVDETKGFYVFRNQWQDKNDFVASIYGKRQFLPKSWSFPDAGSFRIAGLGGQWAIAGMGNGKRDSENVIVTKIDENPTTEPIFCQSHPDGSGSVTFQGDNWLRAFAVDYSGKSGSPGLFVVVDQFQGVNQQRTWTMHTQGKVTLNQSTFTIEADNGATLQGTFITPQNVQLSYQPDTQTIEATGDNEFFVIMTVQKGIIPKLKRIGQGLNTNITINKQLITFNNKQLTINQR
ncbi:conserved hypothetical protein [Rippkaea orientalis PCC 8801]|uniref:Heparinase II/III family protein n=1 Tax=Rippkaea orientalis (strain PCC 8801 / RF-1) TaxID=41431 RepID=B7K3A3_RIPO1|nr:conserved hypothetical protein [Rippkaea orientalis PCC 8801]